MNKNYLLSGILCIATIFNTLNGASATIRNNAASKKDITIINLSDNGDDLNLLKFINDVYYTKATRDLLFKATTSKEDQAWATNLANNYLQAQKIDPAKMRISFDIEKAWALRLPEPFIVHSGAVSKTISSNSNPITLIITEDNTVYTIVSNSSKTENFVYNYNAPGDVTIDQASATNSIRFVEKTQELDAVKNWYTKNWNKGEAQAAVPAIPAPQQIAPAAPEAQAVQPTEQPAQEVAPATPSADSTTQTAPISQAQTGVPATAPAVPQTQQVAPTTPPTAPQTQAPSTDGTTSAAATSAPSTQTPTLAPTTTTPPPSTTLSSTSTAGTSVSTTSTAGTSVTTTSTAGTSISSTTTTHLPTPTPTPIVTGTHLIPTSTQLIHTSTHLIITSTHLVVTSTHLILTGTHIVSLPITATGMKTTFTTKPPVHTIEGTQLPGHKSESGAQITSGGKTLPSEKPTPKFIQTGPGPALPGKGRR